MEAPYKSNCMKSWDISGYNMSVNYAFSVFLWNFKSTENPILILISALQKQLSQTSNNIEL